MSDTPRTDALRDKLATMGWNPHKDKPVADLCVEMDNLERELAEAKFDLQFRRDLYALQSKELAEAREQRDTLAEALQGLLNAHQPRPFGGIVDKKERLNAETNQIFETLEATHKARQALAAVKGGSDE